MFTDHKADNPEIQIKMEASKDYYEKEVPVQASQIECTWEEVKA